MEHASAHIARYKLPKEVVFVEHIQRSPSGKADYRWAAETAVKAAERADDIAGPARRARRIVTTPRLVLRPFTDMDRAPFFELNTHPLVVESLGSSPSRAESDAMIDRFSAEMAREGWGLWAVEVAGGAPFAGMVGLHRVPTELPFAPAVEIGWRLHPDHWGHGYATEAAAASLRYGFGDGRAGRDRRLHDDREPPLAGGDGAHRHGARPGRRFRPPSCPRAARCGATCSTGSAPGVTLRP